MTTPSSAFPAGIVLTTKRAERALRRTFGPDRAAVRRATVAFVLRHIRGDFGEADPQLAERNRAAVRGRGPILSRYTLPRATGKRRPVRAVLTVVTDECREFTTVAVEDRAKN